MMDKGGHSPSIHNRIGGWISSMVSLHSVDYDSAKKRSEALTQAPTWMDLGHNDGHGEKPDAKDPMF